MFQIGGSQMLADPMHCALHTVLLCNNKACLSYADNYTVDDIVFLSKILLYCCTTYRIDKRQFRESHHFRNRSAVDLNLLL